MSRCVGAIVDIGHTPLAAEHVAVLASVTGRAAVVDVDKRETSARPVLVLEDVDGQRGAGRSAVAVHDQRRFHSWWTLEVRVARRVAQRMPGNTDLGRELDRQGAAEVVTVDVR